ncbi:MAG: hypothetical protein NUV53_03645 [Patescibacteria group bacterium]|nr:hypothetical protein [Patescibacteria group bacterium]
MGDLGDVFETLFENFGGRPRRRTYSHGSDLEVKEEIELKDSLRGTVRHLRFATFSTCETCKGKGADSDAGFSQCGACGGRGEVRVDKRTFFGSFSQVKACTQCHGSGQIPNKICRSCEGNGRKTATREVDVEILPGIEDNQLIKVKGMGEAGERGSASGDLYIRIRIKPHAIFERRGNDLVMKYELKLSDLFLGKKISISTLGGNDVSIEIPAHFNLKDLFHIPGEGMPRFGSRGRGDLLVDFILKAPKKLSTKARKTLEDISGEL